MFTRKYRLLFLQLLFVATVSFGQQNKPKLVIGLVIDQMRWDYLYRYSDLYGANGFKKLMAEGYNCENTYVPYVPTYTAVGHTCIYTGSIPAVSGIVGNNWFERSINRSVYCTEDTTVSPVGTKSNEGKMSPENLWVTTITDELRLSNNFKSKVIGIALKDRGGILPAGHTANAAYWYEDTIGKWISSSYYMKELPAWVNDFNSKDQPGKYMSRDWTTVMPIDKYDLSTPDEEPYEAKIPGERTVSFPHKINGTMKQKYFAFKYTPFAATYTFDFAKATIDNENLGANTVTDFLAISISSTDYMGHTFGPNSVEAEDTYLRLDKDIASFIDYLDVKLGRGNYTIFLTADHGVVQIPGFLKSHHIPAGTFSESELKKVLNDTLAHMFGVKNIVQSLQNYQLYLDLPALDRAGKTDAVKEAIIAILQAKAFILNAFETNRIEQVVLPEPIKSRIINGYNPKRSGDIQFTLKAGYYDGSATGTSHGIWNPYDSHIPLLWYGWGIKAGKTNREVYMTDIAPTLAALLKIQMPSGCVGKVIAEVLQ